MKKSTVSLSLMLSAILLISSLSYVRAQPTRAIKEPIVTVTNTSQSHFSGYNITAETVDGGRVTFLFVWQRKVSWDYAGISGEIAFDTPPILQVSRYFPNETLDYSIAYVPLFLIQCKDADDNGLFDLWTVNRHGFTEEINDDLIDWSSQLDKPYKAYALAPIFYFRRQHAWDWTVNSLTRKDITVDVNGDQVEVPTYSWNISATIPSITWLREQRYGWRPELPEVTTIRVYFGYHIRLLPDSPEVKYDFKFDGITWANDDETTRLAMVSAVLYHSKERPVVHIGVSRYWNFSETTFMSVAIRRLTISDDVRENINAFVSYDPDAIVDGVEATDTVKTALHPLFLIPIPNIMMDRIPAGVYISGVVPGMGVRRIWRHYLAFSHQLGLPHFNASIEQDPVIGIAATLATVPLQFMPGDLLPLRTLTVLAAISTVATAIYILLKRRTTGPF